MALKAIFDSDVKFKSLEGYRISLYMRPDDGIGDHFYVYLWDRIDADQEFESEIKVGEPGERRRGKLEISGSGRTYTFNDIDLSYAIMGATRRYRYRFLEFRYTKQNIDDSTSPVSLSNNFGGELERGGLQDKYKYHLGGGSEQLYGLSSLVGSEQVTVVRFASLRNNKNSFIEKILEINSDQADDGQMSDFTVGFSQDNLDVTRANLQALYIDESYGDLKSFAPPPLAGFIDAGRQARPGDLARVIFPEFSAEALQRIDAGRDDSPETVADKSVETATFVFHPAKFRGFSVK